MIAVEVRHATLNTHDRSGGPAQNTEHTSSQEEKEKEKEEEKTHIKSNNPHLTGGEQPFKKFRKIGGKKKKNIGAVDWETLFKAGLVPTYKGPSRSL